MWKDNRPEGWKDIKQLILEEPNGMDKFCCSICGDKIVELTADAMLKAQFKQGELYCLHDNGGLTIKSWACPICRKELKESLGF